ncbi:hypothetical protein CSZ94_25935 [Janthinobacterium sp. ROICE36]|uniref:hypothetical protein n=1 Tax=Janthinobacterium sp. ROICE36 TaxID=2048670 RepID=UPI000C7F6A83|nr:hypothetical protein [Janthinobacterium sp. ROICE36]PLY39521.1 hypothetical protein CSZ94_25935 [Janthinobacterium sp. ROICE36]
MPDQHPLYQRLVQEQPQSQEKPGSDFRAKLAGYGITQEQSSDVLWNVEKFLISKDGKVVGHFSPDTTLDDAISREAIDRELAA